MERRLGMHNTLDERGSEVFGDDKDASRELRRLSSSLVTNIWKLGKVPCVPIIVVSISGSWFLEMRS